MTLNLIAWGHREAPTVPVEFGDVVSARTAGARV
jgi:hypothetical protein